MKKYLYKLSPFFFIILLLSIIFYKVIFLGEVYYYGDNFHLNAPLKHLFKQEIKAGNFPLWNPYIFIGMPYFADLNLGTLYPLNILYFLFTVEYALTLKSIIDIFLIAMFSYLFFRTFKFTKRSCLLGSIVFAFSGEIFVYINNITILNVIVFIPLIIFLARKIILENKLRFLFFLFIAQAIQLFSGHPQVSYYTMFFTVFILFFTNNSSIKSRITLILMYVIVSILFASFQLIPFLELVMNSSRPFSNFAYASSGSFFLQDFITFILPTFYGSLQDGDWWGKQQMLIGYLSIPALFFLFIGLKNSKFSNKRLYIILLTLSLVLAFGRNTPIYHIFYFFVPGWSLFRQPSQILIFYAFFAALFVVSGVDIVLKNYKITSLNKVLLLPALSMFILLIGLYLRASQGYFWFNLLQSLRKIFHISQFQQLLTYNPSKFQSILQNILLNIVILLFLILITYLIILWGKGERRKYIYYILLVIISLNLLFFDSKVMLTINNDLYSINKNVFKELIESRMLSLNVDLHQNRYYLPGQDFFIREAKANLLIYKGNQNIVDNIYQVNGYSSLIPSRFTNFVSDKNAITGVDIPLASSKKINLLGIRYVLSKDKISKIDFNEKTKDNYFIYENKSAVNRAYFLEYYSKNKLEFKTISNEEMKLKIFTPEENRLILVDQYFPGWIAFINGKQAEIVAYNNTFRMIFVPKGESEVKFIYKPLSLFIGTIISVVSFLIILIFFIIGRKKIYNIFFNKKI